MFSLWLNFDAYDSIFLFMKRLRFGWFLKDKHEPYLFSDTKYIVTIHTITTQIDNADFVYKINQTWDLLAAQNVIGK